MVFTLVVHGVISGWFSGELDESARDDAREALQDAGWRPREVRVSIFDQGMKATFYATFGLDIISIEDIREIGAAIEDGTNVDLEPRNEWQIDTDPE